MFEITIWEILRALGAFFAVIALTIWSLWLYTKRIPRLPGGVMRVAGILPLERNIRIYLVKVAGTYILVGVSKDKLTHLCTLDEKAEVDLDVNYPDSAGMENVETKSFKGFLQRIVERMRTDHNDEKTNGSGLGKAD